MDFYTSKPKLIFIQIFFIFLIVLFLTVFRTVAGVLISLLFAFLVIKTIPDLFISEPVLRFDQNGIQTSNRRSNRFGLISWDDIDKINIGYFRFNRFLMIEVKDSEKFRARVIAEKGKLLAMFFRDPSPYISLSFDLLTPSLDKALDYIRSHHSNKMAND